MSEKDDFDLRVFLPYLLNQAAESASLEFQSVYKARYGMLRTEWRVLFHLGIFGRMTAKAIVDRAGIHKTKISRAVQRLEDRRFLTRARDDDDRRQEHLQLTPAGQSVYRELKAIAAEYDARLTQDFSDAEITALRSALQKLARI